MATDVKNLYTRMTLKERLWKHRAFYLMLLPSFVLLFIFAYAPMYGITIAFKDFSFTKGIFGSSWVGFKYFQELFAIDQFWVALKNTVVINLLKLVFGFPTPIILAIMLNAVGNKSVKKIVQTIVYLPHFVSWVVVSSLIFSLFDSDSGLIVLFLGAIGVDNVNLLGNSNVFLATLVISDIWKEIGWGAIIYLAALSGISPEYYEAAEIDGANKIKQFTYITLPLLLPTITIMLILRMGSLISGGFDQVYNLYNKRVYNVADILDTFIYRYGIDEGRWEMATAVGLFVNVINVILLTSANKITELVGGETLY